MLFLIIVLENRNDSYSKEVVLSAYFQKQSPRAGSSMSRNIEILNMDMLLVHGRMLRHCGREYKKGRE